MGADLCLSWFCIKEGKNLDEIKKKMLNEVDKLNIKNLNEIEETIEEMGMIDEVEEKIEEMANKEKDLRKKIISSLEGENQEYIGVAKEIFKEIIKDAFESVKGHYRDVAEIRHKGEIIYISGGMSWGDIPTDSCDVFYKFGNLPKKVLKAGGING